MIKPEQIPDEVVVAFEEAYWNQEMTVAEAIAAAINAWPDTFITKYSEGAPAFNLPLPQDK